MIEEEEETEKPKAERVEPETGPPLLTPLSEDTSLEVKPMWSVRCSSNIIDNFAIAIVRSNLWPGAFCFSTQGKYFQNIYIGKQNIFNVLIKNEIYLKTNVIFSLKT